MSRFAALRDDDGDNGSDEYIEPSDAFEKLTPQYTIQEILNLYKSSINEPPPPEIMRYENVFIQDPQTPECSSFHPPKSEINSTIYLNANGKNQNRRNTRTPQRGGRGKPNAVNEKRADSQNNQSNDEPEEDLSQLWYYKDPLDCIVGPYTSHQMQEWLEKRYIDASLPIRNAASEARFQPISVIFQDTSKAFAETNSAKPTGAANNECQAEKRITTLISFSMDDDNEEWEREDQKI
ncbi:hypothetical protein TRFO_24569 [Tritrichomonas foetus]|uniref:GYF domain-containing protein n=1 Tax=Tritrichomonas foetus TaxID=1144522 RepID=A0A1J4KC97_9EUKA|nr:hypothetical protein TRFO_24569 [Tritrichomonas foetus]|eukprot:OHT07308.1 hypothetical protein TRFO_24569 [Tritrichomonas foetus]